MKQSYHSSDESLIGPTPRGYKTIRIPCDEYSYNRMLIDSNFFKESIEKLHKEFPELFPSDLSRGYRLNGFTAKSKKTQLRQRRIEMIATKEIYSVAPCYVMPYMTGMTKDVERALFLRRFNVPFWALSFVFGKDPMYWYRMETGFGRNSLVGSTVKAPEKLPQHLSADEKHTKLNKQNVYVATTVGAQCILGASVCASADEKGLTTGYGHFQQEATNVAPEYKPETVNTDGWGATGLSWKHLFPLVTIIGCFLHAFIKIRDRCKKYKSIFHEACDKVWDVYEAKNKRSFSQRMRRLKAWSHTHTEGMLKDKLLALCNKVAIFSIAYDHEGCHRTSNMVDRLMRWMDQYLFSIQYFHGNLRSAEQGIRAWALLRNFQPHACSIKHGKKEIVCAAKNLNGFVYRDNWLENLIVATSMAGYRQ